MNVDDKLELQFVLDGLGQGILIFDKNGNLVSENLAARTLLATDINLLRSEGWTAAATLFNAGQETGDSVENVRSQALTSERPVRFHIIRSGQYVPCWAAAIQGKNGEMYTMISLENPDWEMIDHSISHFRDELGKAVEDTLGHIKLINRTVETQKPDATAADLAKRVGNFIQLIDIHMTRSQRFMSLFERLQIIRTNKIRDAVYANRKKIDVEDYIEDFLEELDEVDIIDPETDAGDHRARIAVDIETDGAIHASQKHLTPILQDILRNAIMYSLRGTPIRIVVQAKNHNIQIDVVDEGYGVREKEVDRVFAPFQRARQPQVISEFGYGLSLYLCKHEVEAMNGRIWFKSDEGLGTTFSIQLPAWREAGESSSSDQQ